MGDLMDQENPRLADNTATILIADTHVSPAQGNDVEFREMLTALAASSYDVVFLGDILDLWIALPGYESTLHDEFVEWCRAEREKRTVGFVEGNHEFFLAQGHPDAFSFVAVNEYVDAAKRLFVHGDTANGRDWSYHLFRRLTKNPVIHWLEKVVPVGPPISRFIKKHLNARREALPRFFPEDDVATFVDGWLDQGVTAVYMGHFHDRHCAERPGGGHYEVVPAWRIRGEVVILENEAAVGRVCHWRDVLPG